MPRRASIPRKQKYQGTPANGRRPLLGQADDQRKRNLADGSSPGAGPGRGQAKRPHGGPRGRPPQCHPDHRGKPRRVGGATYQVPVEIRAIAACRSAVRWLVQSARKRKWQEHGEKLAAELVDAMNGLRAAVKRARHHKMAEANRAFSTSSGSRNHRHGRPDPSSAPATSASSPTSMPADDRHRAILFYTKKIYKLARSRGRAR